jgi:hypothetical protein
MRIFATILFFFSFSLEAHKGHDHDAPVGIQAPMGGIIKKLDESHVEVTIAAGSAQIYFYDKDFKPRSPAGFKVKATAQLPRSKKIEKVDLRFNSQHIEIIFDAKKSHRYTLKLLVTDSLTGHEDRLTFNIETRK